MMNQLRHKWAKSNFVAVMQESLVTIAILIMAVTLNGDWVVIAVHAMKEFGFMDGQSDFHVKDTFDWLSLNDFRYFWISTMLTGYGIYFALGIFFHWYYYVMQKDHPETWKCQPTRWLSRELEIDEIQAGCLSLFVTNTWSALIACYTYNNGKYSTVYHKWDEYGIIWWFLQFPVVFIYQDYMTYWLHRLFHYPYLYNRFHKTHHKYREPTAFSVTAIHPVEMSFMQMVLVIPLFSIPVHWVPLYIILLNGMYHGTTAHSGINFKAKWWQPWQPDAIFHDNHHRYYHLNFAPYYVSTVYSFFFGIIIHSGITFKAKWWQPWQSDAVYHDNHHQYHHLNFGVNSFWWDVIHNTYRQPDRIYNENIFYGHGKHISELTPEEIQNEIKERETETKTAYDSEDNPYISSLMKINLENISTKNKKNDAYEK